MNGQEKEVNVYLQYDLDRRVSPYLFGDNLEHTRGCINGGLSAEKIRNRKFVGKPTRFGYAHEWYPIGEKTIFSFGESYTRHAEGYSMHRSHEMNAQYITNYYRETGGIGQKDLYFKENTDYVFTAAIKAFKETNVKVRISSHSGETYDEKVIRAETGDYAEKTVTLHAPMEDFEGRIEITFDTVGTIMIGAVSLMEADNFRGMRKDVIEKMKELGIRLLRWPGGNFAGEYNWKDGLLPRNMRAPLQSYLWLETQPHTYGYDFHDINTDDFIALCREIGAEPFITLNPTWNTPEESTQWVEYCNGDENTEYGALRANNGYKEPYNVKFWSLGNEAGYGHMEGANTADAYQKAVRNHAERMLEVTPDLALCSSGPYPNEEWAKYSACALSDVAKAVSLHYYAHFPEFIDPEKKKEEYEALIGRVEEHCLPFIRTLREQLGESHVAISFDEWNAWYAWYRKGSVAEGMFAASFMNMIIENAEKYGVKMCCHFESVNEGAIQVTEKEARLSATGQVLALMNVHAGAKVCAVQKNIVSSCKRDVVTTTLINSAFDEKLKYIIRNAGEVINAEIYVSDDVVPGTVFDIKDFPVKTENREISVVLPPHSIAVIRTKAIPEE
ncbi:MAG: hypothetical protein E7322_06195 [Clostridiales bacterium]|nr:hypothetical protein [Clostridiales bacterium]